MFTPAADCRTSSASWLLAASSASLSGSGDWSRSSDATVKLLLFGVDFFRSSTGDDGFRCGAADGGKLFTLSLLPLSIADRWSVDEERGNYYGLSHWRRWVLRLYTGIHRQPI